MPFVKPEHADIINRERRLSESLQAYPWKKAFQAEGYFSWGRYYSHGQFEQFKSLLREHKAHLIQDTESQGRCMNCSARMSIGDICVIIPNQNPGGYDTITLIERYRDHNC
jgi:hypothetical protein